jgi:hypothetical protein
VRQSELLRDELFNKFKRLGHEGLRNLSRQFQALLNLP